MDELPDWLWRDWQAAGNDDIRSWSYGAVRAVVAADPGDVRGIRGTLADPAIFGPTRDHHCACGKYAGLAHEGTICDRCGVRVTTSAVRRQRFGHVNLPESVAHPLDADADRLDVFPVLPAGWREAPPGVALDASYERLVLAAQPSRTQWLALDRALVMREIVDALIPAFCSLAEWRLPDAATLGRGLALVPRD